ncbi:hypothetical protein CYMTET_44981 [Cymbomonas tetramitiformis]|uniref:Uncharacterized protein n=1 Tax=Cymbomonas tetramitiformis TaxID=36881 RepID=A0AAE0C0B3_9CHLO|nr:hypothetical protein CYMTET_44981 [Cymbomonas tetramitiformis]
MSRISSSTKPKGDLRGLVTPKPASPTPSVTHNTGPGGVPLVDPPTSAAPPLDDPILTTGPTPVMEKPTHREISAVDYFEDTANLRHTPYRASTRGTLTDHLAKTFEYAENGIDVLKARDYHPRGSGITLDGVNAKRDYFALRSAMATVLDSVDSVETAKIFDFDLAFAAYNYDANAVAFTMLSVLIRGPALDVYHSTAKLYPFDGSRALLLRLHFDVEGVQRGDKGKFMEDMRALRIDDRDTLTHRIRRVWLREGVSRLARPITPDSGGVGDSSSPSGGGRVMAFRSRYVFAAEGKWEETGGPYRIWNGQGRPCVVCYRLYALTDVHADTNGLCPWVCVDAFSTGSPPTASAPIERPTLASDAWQKKDPQQPSAMTFRP